MPVPVTFNYTFELSSIQTLSYKQSISIYNFVYRTIW